MKLYIKERKGTVGMFRPRAKSGREEKFRRVEYS